MLCFCMVLLVTANPLSASLSEAYCTSVSHRKRRQDRYDNLVIPLCTFCRPNRGAKTVSNPSKIQPLVSRIRIFEPIATGVDHGCIIHRLAPRKEFIDSIPGRILQGFGEPSSEPIKPSNLCFMRDNSAFAGLLSSSSLSLSFPSKSPVYRLCRAKTKDRLIKILAILSWPFR